MLLTNMIVTVLLIVMTSAPAVSNHPTTAVFDAEPQNRLMIQEDKFSCFQNLHCLIKDDSFNRSYRNAVRLNSNEFQKFIVEGSSKNEDVYAVYDGVSGRLIEATVIQRNIILPRSITEVLIADEYKDWIMIGNELVVQNFDKNSMQYKVVLQRGDEVRIEYFDKNGNTGNRMS
jgi:hypothetical protein